MTVNPPLIPPELIFDSSDVYQNITEGLILNENLPGLVSGEATALLIDVNNLYSCARRSNFRIDYGRLKTVFSQRCDLRYCGAFSSMSNRTPEVTNKNNRWMVYMRRVGYEVVTKKEYLTASPSGETIVRGDMDISMTIAAMKLNSAFAHIILGTCDGDFVELIDELKKDRFRKVSVLGIKDPNAGGIRKDLMEKADNFYDIMKFKEYVELVKPEVSQEGD